MKQRNPMFKNMTDAQLTDYYTLVLYQNQVLGLAYKTFDHELSAKAFQFSIENLAKVKHACDKRKLNLDDCTNQVMDATYSGPREEPEYEVPLETEGT